MSDDRHLRVGVAQIHPALGDVASNLDKHLSWIERARAQVFDVPDALRASVKVALVEDVHCGASGRVQRLARLARLERGAGERE